MKVNHIGYLVKKLEKAKKEFLNLGYQVMQEDVYDDFRGINISFLEKDGYVVELVEPVSADSVVGSLQKKVGNSPYHICYEVESIEQAIEELRLKRYVSWDEPHEAKAFGGKRVCFLIHPYLGMIELLEK